MSNPDINSKSSVTKPFADIIKSCTKLGLSADAVVLLDRQGKVIFSNAPMERMFPGSQGPMQGKLFTEYLPVSERKKIDDAVSSVLDDGEIVKNEEFVLTDEYNNIFYFFVNFSPIRSEDGEIVGIIGIFRDITEKYLSVQKLRNINRNLEEKLEESHKHSEFLKQMSSVNDEIIRMAPIGIFVIESTGKLFMQNPTLSRIFKQSEGKIDPGSDLYNFILADPGLKSDLDSVLNRKTSVRINNLKYSYSGDKEKIINIWIMPVTDAHDEVKYLVFLVEDVTKRSLMGDKIQRAEKLSAMGIMASGIAEEIKFPLTHIIMNLDFVERNTSEDSPARPYLQAIKDDLTRIKFVSKQIRSLSLPSDILDNEVFEVTRLFLDPPLSIKLHVMHERAIEVRTFFPDKSPKVNVNKNQLIQALTHIIQNAAEAVWENGVIAITVDTFTEDGHKAVVITIDDSGMGISDENMMKIFKPFFTTKGKSATGLGLMVAFSIIDNMHGAIGIKSSPGEGTSVRISLPAYIEKEQE